MDKNNNIRDKIIDVIIVICLILVVLSIFALFAGSLMHILGLQYRSVKSLILYFVISSIVGYLLNILFVIFYGIIIKVFHLENKINKYFWKISLVLLDILSSIWGFMIIDYYMFSVSANFISILVISIIFALFDIKKDNKT